MGRYTNPASFFPFMRLHGTPDCSITCNFGKKILTAVCDSVCLSGKCLEILLKLLWCSSHGANAAEH